MAQEFTRKAPPKSGQARKLWDWWKKCHKGKGPDSLTVTRPGHWQRSNGSCHYFIMDKGAAYLIWDVAATLAMRPEDSKPLSGGDLSLG